MKPIKVGAAILNQTPLDWSGNGARIAQAIAQARAQGVSLLCLPELSISGYGCEDAFLAAGAIDAAWESLETLIDHTAGMAVSFGLPVLYHGGLYNAAALVCDGALVGIAPKRFLAGDGLHYEPRWFNPWPEGRIGELRRGDQAWPIGDIHFDLGGVKLGYEVCEDAWVADRPGAALARQGVDIILNPSASHFAFGKQDIRERYVVEGSRAFGVTYVYTNLVGNEAGRVIYDGGALIATAGRLVAAGPRLGYEPVHVTSTVIDVELTRMARAGSHSFVPDVGDDPELVARFGFAWPDAGPEPPAPSPPAWESGAHRKEEAFTRAVTLGLFDYLRKSRARGFVVSLSGGADSAAVACLVALMVQRGLDALGVEGLARRLPQIAGLAEASDARGLVGRLLTTAYQSTAQSGPVTRAAAADVAEAIGATHHELDVEALVQGYLSLAEGALGRAITWEDDDLARQNIQARARGPSVWMLANIQGALLLSTSNRSEAAVGYATMDGDTCGGLSPIAGIDKAFLRRWLGWLERIGPEGIGPIPALAAVNAQQPTAELRPQEMGQTDESDLMPYPLLDAIERAAIRDKKMPVEVFALMGVEFPEIAAAQLGVWVERFFTLWCRNQWKRERYAPSFHLDDENLDPKTWCRFPILSSGFDEELQALRDLVAKS